MLFPLLKVFFSYLLYIFSNKALFTDWCTFIFPSNCHRYHISPLSYRILRPIYHFGVIVQSAFYLGIPVCKIHNGKERLKVIAGNLHSRFRFSRQFVWRYKWLNVRRHFCIFIGHIQINILIICLYESRVRSSCLLKIKAGMLR